MPAETPITAIVFDIGNVLLRWRPERAFAHHVAPDEMVDFLERTEFFARNLRADAGERFADLAQEIDDRRDRALIAGYPDRYALTIEEPIEGSWSLLQRLRDRGFAIHAITNWAAETWQASLAQHPRLATAFDVTLVSGQLGLAKPDRAIFDLLCQRTGLAPGACLFIDDNADNVAGAQAAGMAVHHFRTPEVLADNLTRRGLL